MSSDGIALGHVEGVYPLLDLLQVGFVLIGPDGEVRHASDPARRLIGRRRVDASALAQLLGDLHDDLIAPILDGRSWTTRWREHRFVSPRGDDIELAIRSVAIEDVDGSRRVLLAFYDVSVEIGLHRRYKELLARQEAINEELRKRIAEELREHEDDLTQFSELLQVAPAIFASFVAEAEAAVRAVASLAEVDEGGRLDDAAAVVALLESHTLKGNSRGLGLNFIAGRAHAVEELIVAARESGRTARSELQAALADLRRAIERAVALRGGLESAAGTSAPEARAAALAEVTDSLTEALALLAADHPARARLERALSTAERVARIPLSQLIHYLRVTARSAAAASGREQPAVDVIGVELAVPAQVHAALQAALPHLVRNAIVHGIESPAVRAAAGKPAAGMITIEARLDGADLVVVVSDDGRGIDHAALASRLADGANHSLSELVFLPGLSSHQGVDLDAGRGMGALAARDTLTAVGGSLVVTSRPGRGTSFTARIPRAR